IGAGEVVWSYSGVRPLYDDGTADPSAVTRDYVLKLDTGEGSQAPLLSVFGGKITTYRRLAESALSELKPFFPQMKGDWTRAAPTMCCGGAPSADCISLSVSATRSPRICASSTATNERGRNATVDGDGRRGAQRHSWRVRRHRRYDLHGRPGHRGGVCGHGAP